MPRLVVLRDGTVHCQVELGLQDLVIGRAADSDVVLEDPGHAVSRHHAEVHLEDDRYVMIDVGSENGIWNGPTRVQTAKLTHGTLLSVGSFDIRFEDDVDDAATMIVGAPDAQATPPLAAGRPGILGDMTPSCDPGLTMTRAPAHPPAPASAVLLSSVTPNLKPAVPQPTERARNGHRPIWQRLASVIHRAASFWRGGAGRLARRPKAVLVGAGFVVGIVVVAAAFGPALLHLLPAPGADRTDHQATVQSAEEEFRRQLTDARGALDRRMLQDARQIVEKALVLAPANGEALALQGRIQEQTRIDATRAGSAGDGTPVPAPPQVNTIPEAPQPRSVRQQPEVTPWPLLAKRPDETPEATRERSQSMFKRYRQAESLLQAGRFSEAAVEGAAIAAEEPSYLAIATLMLDARQGIAGQATRAIEAGSVLERTGEFVAAMSQYERAKQLDPSLRASDALIRQLRERMLHEGAPLYTRAKQYDALGRSTEAADLYDRVLKMLPADDPRYGLAQARVKVLRTGGR